MNTTRNTSEEELRYAKEQFKIGYQRYFFLYVLIIFIYAITFILLNIFFDNNRCKFHTEIIIFDSLLAAFSLFLMIKMLNDRQKRKISDFGYIAFAYFCLIWSVYVCIANPEAVTNISVTFFNSLVLLLYLSTSYSKTIYRTIIAIMFVEIFSLSYLYWGKLFYETSILLSLLLIFLIIFTVFFKRAELDSTISRKKIEEMNCSLEQKVKERTKDIEITNRILQDALVKAEKSERLKMEFLSNISHEIRTPLNSIVGFAELLALTPATDEERKEYSHRIELNTSGLLSIIEEVLDVSYIKTEQVEYKGVNLLLFKFLDELAQSIPIYRAKYGKDNIIFELHKPLTDVTFESDETLLKKILFRLIDNAFKFTDNKGSIDIEGSVSFDGQISFSVTDTGVGISDEKQKDIFEAFVQGDGSLTRDYGGSGLGLTAAKGFADILKATISLRSMKGKGTTFTITLPRSATISKSNKHSYSDTEHLNLK